MWPHPSIQDISELKKCWHSRDHVSSVKQLYSLNVYSQKWSIKSEQFSSGFFFSSSSFPPRSHCKTEIIKTTEETGLLTITRTITVRLFSWGKHYFLSHMGCHEVLMSDVSYFHMVFRDSFLPCSHFSTEKEINFKHTIVNLDVHFNMLYYLKWWTQKWKSLSGSFRASDLETKEQAAL